MDRLSIGQAVKFDPVGNIDGYGMNERRAMVTGKVIYVNHSHRWFAVEHGGMRYGFKADTIGTEVIPVG